MTGPGLSLGVDWRIMIRLGWVPHCDSMWLVPATCFGAIALRNDVFPEFGPISNRELEYCLASTPRLTTPTTAIRESQSKLFELYSPRLQRAYTSLAPLLYRSNKEAQTSHLNTTPQQQCPPSKKSPPTQPSRRTSPPSQHPPSSSSPSTPHGPHHALK